MNNDYKIENKKHHQGCNCKHEHEHEEFNCDWEQNIPEEEICEDITITHHEGAFVLSVSKDLNLPYDEVSTELTVMLKELATWVDSNGGITGHIKAYITEKSRSAMISTTGGTCNVIPRQLSVTGMDLTVIVFMVNEYEVCHKINRMLKDSLNRS